jgi:hypothetical protein
MTVWLARRVLGILNDPNSSFKLSAVYYIAMWLMWLDRMDKFVRNGLEEYLLTKSNFCP